MKDFQIHLINSDEITQSELNSALEQVVKKIFPEFRPFAFPDWLLEDPVRLYEKEGTVLVVKLLTPFFQFADVFTLVQLKLKVEKSIRVFNRDHQVMAVVLGQKIPTVLQKMFFMEDNLQVYEVILSKDTHEIFVRQLTDYHDPGVGLPAETKQIESKDKGKSEFAPKVVSNVAPSEPPLKQDISMSSFFYKMGELTDDPNQFLLIERGFWTHLGNQ